MLCCPHCSMLSTILFSIVTPDCGLIQAQQCWTILLTTLNNVGSTTLFKAVFINPEQVVRFYACIQGVRYSQKYRVKRDFPNYFQAEFSQFDSAKKELYCIDYIYSIKSVFSSYNRPIQQLYHSHEWIRQYYIFNIRLDSFGLTWIWLLYFVKCPICSKSFTWIFWQCCVVCRSVLF